MLAIDNTEYKELPTDVIDRFLDNARLDGQEVTSITVTSQFYRRLKAQKSSCLNLKINQLTYMGIPINVAYK